MTKPFPSIFLATALLFSLNAAAQIINTFAGTGAGGFSGDGGSATSAQLNNPFGVTVDTSGNVYIVDLYNHRIRKVDTAGIISTFAGTGAWGFSGDGGPATSAQLYYPTGIAVDASGNVFIADRYNHRIRKVTAAGVISTFAGTGVGGFSGDGVDAANAQLYYPDGVAVDASGNAFIADAGNNRIRKVDTAGVISTFAGTGLAGFSGDGGSANSAQLSNPRGVAVDASDNVFISDYSNQRIRKVDTAGIISTFAGTGFAGFSGDGVAATSAKLNYPTGVAFDASGNVFIADKDNNRIRKVTTAGVISTFAGTGVIGFSGDGGGATSAQLSNPSGVAVDVSGNAYIADYYNNRIRKVTSCIPPIVIANATATTVCSGTSVTLTGSGASSYVWTGGVTNGVGFIPSFTLTYTVTGTHASGCTNTSTVTVTVEPCTGVSTLSNEQSLLVYPNPNIGQFWVSIPSGQVQSFEIYNVLGEKIYQSNGFPIKSSSPENSGQIDLSSQPSGIYFIFTKWTNPSSGGGQRKTVLLNK